jgi:LysR family transcriptional activator of nhaA
MMAVIRKLNYQHLLYFWSVVRTGSLTRACEELALSAPTISAQLRTLEGRLGEKLLTKAGRTLVPTEVGRLVYGYADEIFGLGHDLVEALEHRPTRRSLRVVVGIDDVVPKEIAHRLLEPALALKQPVRLVCREGTLERLVADWRARIDLTVRFTDRHLRVRPGSYLGTWGVMDGDVGLAQASTRLSQVARWVRVAADRRLYTSRTGQA